MLHAVEDDPMVEAGNPQAPGQPAPQQGDLNLYFRAAATIVIVFLFCDRQKR